jgi:hypothetical protein
MLAALLTLTLAQARPQFAIEQHGDSRYLRDGNERVVMASWGGVYILPNWRRLRIAPTGLVRLYYQGKEYAERRAHDGWDFDPYVEARKWGQNDELWGTPENAEPVRRQSASSGMMPHYQSVFPQADGSVLALVSLLFNRPSVDPVGAQLLVQITKPPVQLRPLKGFVEPEPLPNHVDEHERLFRDRKGRMLLLDRDLRVLSPHGQVGEIVAKIPEGARGRGLAAGRYLILSKVDATAQRPTTRPSGDFSRLATGAIAHISALDIETGQSFELFDLPVTESWNDKLYSDLVVGSDSPYVLHKRPASVVISIHLPSLSAAEFKGDPYMLWQHRAIGWRKGVGLEIHHAGTGKLLGLARPPLASSK